MLTKTSNTYAKKKKTKIRNMHKKSKTYKKKKRKQLYIINLKLYLIKYD